MKLDIFNWIVVCKWTGGACDRDSVGLGELLTEAGATLGPDCTSLWFWFLIELYASFGFLLSAVVVDTIIEIQLSKVEKRHCNYNWLYGFSYPKALIDYSLIRILWETVDTASVFICEMFLFILRLNFNSIWISNIYSQFNCSSFKHFAHRFMRLSPPRRRRPWRDAISGYNGKTLQMCFPFRFEFNSQHFQYKPSEQNGTA